MSQTFRQKCLHSQHLILQNTYFIECWDDERFMPPFSHSVMLKYCF